MGRFSGQERAKKGRGSQNLFARGANLAAAARIRGVFSAHCCPALYICHIFSWPPLREIRLRIKWGRRGPAAHDAKSANTRVGVKAAPVVGLAKPKCLFPLAELSESVYQFRVGGDDVVVVVVVLFIFLLFLSIVSIDRLPVSFVFSSLTFDCGVLLSLSRKRLYVVPYGACGWLDGARSYGNVDRGSAAASLFILFIIQVSVETMRVTVYISHSDRATTTTTTTTRSERRG